MNLLGFNKKNDSQRRVKINGSKLILASLLVLITALFLSCASSSENDSKITQTALELSSLYTENEEYEDALKVLEDAIPLSGDIRLHHNRLLILFEMKEYETVLNEAKKLYIENPHYIKALRLSIDAAAALENEGELQNLYEMLFEVQGANAKDLTKMLEYAHKNNNKRLINNVLSYSRDKCVYDKEFLTLAYEVTKDENYNTAAIYYKESK